MLVGLLSDREPSWETPVSSVCTGLSFAISSFLGPQDAHFRGAAGIGYWEVGTGLPAVSDGLSSPRVNWCVWRRGSTAASTENGHTVDFKKMQQGGVEKLSVTHHLGSFLMGT